MLDSLNSILALVAMTLASYGMGRPIVRGLKLANDDRLETIVWSLALGLIAAGMGLTCMGLAGWIYKPVIGTMTLAAACWGSRCAYFDFRPRPARLATGQAGNLLPDVRRSISIGLAAATALAAGAALIAALAPPTAGDALCYHLELPKVYLAQHALVDLPYSDNGTFPLLVEMLFLWGLALDGPVAAQLVHWGLGLLFGMGGVVLATPVLSRPWAWLAGALVLLVPAVTNQMTAPLNDAGLACFTTLALAAWLRPIVYREDGKWFLVAGLFLGAALGSKYLAMVFALSVATTLAWSCWRWPERRRTLLAGFAVTTVVAVSVAGVWYVRAAWYRGNPVYPFFSQHIGGDAGPDEGDPGRKTPLAWNPAQVAAAPWHVTMQPERFGGRGHQLGPMFLAILPGLFVSRRLRGLGTLLSIAGVYWLLWYGLRQNTRFLLPLVPLLATAAVWVWIEIGRFPRLPRWIASAVMLAAVAVGVAAPLKRARDKLAVAVGYESRVAYLMRVEPTYRAAIAANRPGEAVGNILSQDYRAFYFDGRVTRENVYRRRTQYDRLVRRPTQLTERLRDAGFSHLLLAESRSSEGIGFDPTLGRLADQQLAGELSLPREQRSLRLVTEYDFTDADGAARHYRLLKLR